MPSPEGVPLQARGLERRFGNLAVLRGVDLTVSPGDLLLVAGANGAGKSTLLRLLAGLMRPTKGSVTVRGHSPREVPAARRLVGLLSHQSHLYDDLTAVENLGFAARLYGLPHPERTAAEWLDRLGVPASRANVPVGRLSRGTVQRVAIARALLHGPAVLLLDEPFTGLDAQASERVRGVLRERLAEGLALVMVSHNPSEVWGIARRVGVLAGGGWALEEDVAGPVDGFLARYQEAMRG